LLVHALEKKSSNVPMLSARISSKLRGIGIIIKIFKDMNQIKLDSFPKLSMKQKKGKPKTKIKDPHSERLRNYRSTVPESSTLRQFD
jgi:hypothetical protein